MRHFALLAILLAGCFSNGLTNGPDGALTVDMQAVLLTGNGDSYQLKASGGSVVWESDDPDVVAVDPTGMVTAVAGSGSAHVRAMRGEERSRPVLVYVAQPKPGAVVVEKDQFVFGPELVADNGGEILGSHVRVVLEGIAPPAPGTILVPRDETPVAGRVVSATEVSGGVEVVLEVVAATELFDNVSLRSRGTLITSEGAREDGSRLQATVTEFNVGVFKCKLEAEVGTIATPTFSQTLQADFDYALDVVIVDGELKNLLVKTDGTLGATALGKLELKEEIEAKLTCEWTAFNPAIPAPGWLAFVMQLEVPLGFGFQVEAKLQATLFEVAIEGELEADMTVGFSWDEADGFTDLSGFEITKQELIPKFKAPAGLADAVTLGLSAHVYGFARPQIGLTVPIEDLPAFQLLKLDVGLKQSASLALPQGQASDPGYASAYDLKIDWTVEAGKHVKKFLELVGLADDFTLKYHDDLQIAKSPTGTLSFDPPEIKAGEGTFVTVTFDEGTTEYLGIENLEQIRVYKVGADGTLEFHDFAGASGNVAKYLWTPTAEEVADPPTFVAFVVTDLLLGVQLEIKENSAATPAPALDLGDLLVPGGVFVDSATGVIIEQHELYGEGFPLVPIAWSPDGASRMLFLDFAREIHVANPDGGNSKQLTNGANARWLTWSPDGKKIVYFSDPEGDLRVVDVNGTTDKVVFDGTLTSWVSWSPDSSRLVFSGLEDETGDGMYVVKADGSGLDRIAASGVPSWSPDGNKIAFLATAGEKTELFTINPDGTGEKQLTDAESWPQAGRSKFGWRRGPVWAPDSNRIYFLARNYAGGIGADNDINVIGVSGAGRQNLTNTPDVEEVSIDVSATTGRVVYAALVGEFSPSPQIFYMDGDGSPPFLVAPIKGYPVWRPGK